jgi:mono/diheme cytochrome c family protein
MPLLLPVLAFLAGAAGRQDGPPPPTPPAPGDGELATTRALYVQHCATCHGETGDGKGTQVLEKPARSFKDGGFSYGNTPEALLRTITHGIPGTPMPSFSSALSEEQRKAVAAYVITLGPEVVETKAAETRLVVRDVPLFARGKLPPIADGVPETVRGLLVGTPEGFTFEYALDDVRLLGVRQGDFVERRDWNGRGGDALRPLGMVVYDCASRTGSPFVWIGERSKSTRLRAAFEGTFVRDAQPHLSYWLLAGDPRLLASFRSRVDETVRGLSSSVGSGFARRLVLSGLDDEERGPGWLVCVLAPGAGTAAIASGADWCVRTRTRGAFELLGVTGLREGDRLTCDRDHVSLELRIDTLDRRDIEVVTLLLPAWDDHLRAAWLEERAR